jgi:hypothetical protein
MMPPPTRPRRPLQLARTFERPRGPRPLLAVAYEILVPVLRRRNGAAAGAAPAEDRGGAGARVPLAPAC